MDTLTDIADALYGVAPSEFVEARNAQSADAAAAGDRERATRIRSFVKPPVAAWAVNALVRNRPDEVDDLLELGRRMREASRALDRVALQELGRERQRILGAIARSARELGTELDVSVSEQAATLVQQTFQAALADADAAEAVRSGLLVRPLSSSGVDAVDLAGAVAVPLRLAGPSRTTDSAGADDDPSRGGTTGGGTAAATPTTDAAGPADSAAAEATPADTSASAPRGPRAVTRADADRAAAERAEAREAARAAAKREAEDARQAAEDAANDVADLDLQLRSAGDRREELARRVRDLRDELELAQDELAQLTVQTAALRKERTRAQRASDIAARAAARARRRTDD